MCATRLVGDFFLYTILFCFVCFAPPLRISRWKVALFFARDKVAVVVSPGIKGLWGRRSPNGAPQAIVCRARRERVLSLCVCPRKRFPEKEATTTNCVLTILRWVSFFLLKILSFIFVIDWRWEQTRRPSFIYCLWIFLVGLNASFVFQKKHLSIVFYRLVVIVYMTFVSNNELYEVIDSFFALKRRQLWQRKRDRESDVKGCVTLHRTPANFAAGSLLLVFLGFLKMKFAVFKGSLERII